MIRMAMLITIGLNQRALRMDNRNGRLQQNNSVGWDWTRMEANVNWLL